MTLEQMTSEAYGTYRASDIAAAKSIVNHATKIMLIVHGDDGYLWVTTPKIAAKLEQMGYEIA